MSRVIHTLCTLLLSFLAAAPALAANQPLLDWQTPAGARGLVRMAVANELKKPRENHRFLFRDTTRKPGQVKTREEVETDEGTVGRLVAVNGQPLSKEQQAEEAARLQALLDDPQSWAKKRNEQKEDDARTTRMLQTLPDAFTFQYEGTEPGTWGELIRLRFQPDPSFSPPSRETQVFLGMQGELWIDRHDLHLVKIDGVLFKGVNFGWGILGHLDKGGRFFVQQSKLDAERWDVTHMKLDFTGKALFFFKINIHEDEVTSDFRPVPTHLSLRQGIEMLENPNAMLAGGESASSKEGSR